MLHPLVDHAPGDGGGAVADVDLDHGRLAASERAIVEGVGRGHALGALRLPPQEGLDGAVGKAKEPGAYLPSACVKDGKLYAQSRCVMCRMFDAGSSAVALIGEMTREQALACQRMLGLPATDPLLSEDVWTKAIAAARS